MDDKLNKIFEEYAAWDETWPNHGAPWQKHRAYLSKLFSRHLDTDREEIKRFWKAFNAIHDFNDGDWEEQQEYIEYLWKLQHRI